MWLFERKSFDDPAVWNTLMAGYVKQGQGDCVSQGWIWRIKKQRGCHGQAFCKRQSLPDAYLVFKDQGGGLYWLLLIWRDKDHNSERVVVCQSLTREDKYNTVVCRTDKIGLPCTITDDNNYGIKS